MSEIVSAAYHLCQASLTETKVSSPFILSGMKTSADRIRHARKEAGLTQEELGKRCGVTRAAVAQWEAQDEKKRTEPTLESYRAIAEATGVSLEWLLTGIHPALKLVPVVGAIAEMASAEAMSRVVKSPSWSLTYKGDADPSTDGYELIAKYSVRAAAGNGITADHEAVENELAFRRDWLRRRGLNPKNLRVITASGDSMADRIQDGDVLLIDLSQREIQDGKVYAVRYDGFIRVKRLFKRFDGTLVLHSDNPNAKPRDEEVPRDQLEALAVHIIGRVVWSGGDL